MIRSKKMKDWTKEELDVLNKITTVQNHPNDDEGQSPLFGW